MIRKAYKLVITLLFLFLIYTITSATALSTYKEEVVACEKQGITNTTNKIQEITVKLEETQKQIDISECVVIGDSNTVRMALYKTSIADAKHISAIVGVGVGGFGSYARSNGLTHGKTLKSDLNTLPDTDLDNVIIMLGTNDYRKLEEDFKEQYINIINYIVSRNTSSNIYLITIPPVRDSKSSTIKNEDTDRISKFIREIPESLETKVSIIDLNSYLDPSNMSDSYGDEYHFSEAGAVKAANYIVANL